MNNYNPDATNIPLHSAIDQFLDRSKVDNAEDCDYEVVIHEGSGTAINTVSTDPEVEQTVNAIASVIEEYNTAFNLELPVKIDDVKSIVRGIANKSARDMYTVALSEAADRVIIATTGALITSIANLVVQLSSQAFINTLTVQERVALTREFFDYILKLQEIKEKLDVGNPTIAMKNAIKASKQSSGRSETDNKKIDEILELIKNQSK